MERTTTTSRARPQSKLRGKQSRLLAVRRGLFAPALCVWSLLYVVPHVYWAAGGEFGFSTLKPSATAQDEWQAINAVASVILLLPVGIGIALMRPPTHRRARAALLAACLGGASISVSHGLYGIVYRALNIAGVVEIDGQRFTADRHPWVFWDLLVFEPWFVIEGALFAAAGWAAISSSESRHRWVFGCVAGIALATASGVLGLRVG